VSRNLRDGLILNTVDAGTKFGDAQLASLEKFAPYIVEVELGRTSVTDASFTTLAKFGSLRAIHLEGTAVTGAGLAKLTHLQQLSYLNLSGTQVTQAAVAPLSSMKNLRHLYLYNTPAQPAATVADGQSTARKEP
jgi:Leucine-rich repeat (LRR) protein